MWIDYLYLPSYTYHITICNAGWIWCLGLIIITIQQNFSSDEKEPVNSEVNLKIKSFALVFNKKEYEFLRASMDSFHSHVSLRDGNFAIKGQLGVLSLRDESPHGKLYREKFITTGTQALNFDVFK